MWYRNSTSSCEISSPFHSLQRAETTLNWHQRKSEPTSPASSHVEIADSPLSSSSEERTSRKRKRALRQDEPETVMSRLQRTRRSLLEDPVALGRALRQCWSENATALLRGYDWISNLFYCWDGCFNGCNYMFDSIDDLISKPLSFLGGPGTWIGMLKQLWDGSRGSSWCTYPWGL